MRPHLGEKGGAWKAFLPHRAGKMAQKNRTEWKFRPASIGRLMKIWVCSALSCGLFFLAMEKMAHAKGRRRLSATP